RAREHVFVHVANADDLDRRDLNEAAQIAFAIPARADEPDAFRFLIHDLHTMRAERRERERGRCGLEKTTTIDVHGVSHRRRLAARLQERRYLKSHAMRFLRASRVFSFRPAPVSMYEKREVL